MDHEVNAPNFRYDLQFTNFMCIFKNYGPVKSILEYFGSHICWWKVLMVSFYITENYNTLNLIIRHTLLNDLFQTILKQTWAIVKELTYLMYKSLFILRTPLLWHLTCNKKNFIISPYEGVVLIENSYSSGNESLIGNVSLSKFRQQRWSMTILSTLFFSLNIKIKFVK